MKSIIRSITLLFLTAGTSAAWGHGYGLAVNLDPQGHPASFTTISGARVLDLVTPSSNRTPAPQANTFLDQFGVSAVTDGTGTYYSAAGGGPQTSGTWPAFTSAAYRILSSLYFSDGTGPAVPASANTHINITDAHAGDPNYPGAQAGAVDLYGNTGVLQGYGVSLLDTHELPKHLFLGAGSTQTFGEYGFAYDVTVSFADGSIVTSGPLMVAYALRDPTLPGGSFLTASQTQQDAATSALYAAAVPEPATSALLSIGGIALVLLRARMTSN